MPFSTFSIDDEQGKSIDTFDLPTLYSTNLNHCVDAILDNRPNHLDMLRQLERIHGMSRKFLELNHYIVRHKTKAKFSEEK
jgi:isocitrate/isopropylmalate dehydrogenase